MRKRVLYYGVTVLSGLAVGFAYAWWTHFFGPDTDDRGFYAMYTLFPGLFISSLSLAWLLRALAPEPAADVLIIVDSWLAFGFITCVGRWWVLWWVLIHRPGAPTFISVVNPVWWVVMVVGSAIIWWRGIKRLVKEHTAIPR